MQPNDNASAHPAGQYDAEVRKVIPYYDAIQTETIDLVRTLAGEPAVWLDTGAGTGALVSRALPQFPRTQFVVADPSAGMLGQARARLGGMPESRVRFLEPTGSDGLPRVATGLCAQAVTAIMCHHYLKPEERRAAVRGCFEIMAPGGVLVIFENVATDTPRGAEIQAMRRNEFQRRQGRTEEEIARQTARFGTELLPVSVGEHIALLREVGFATVELFWRAQLQAGFYAVK